MPIPQISIVAPCRIVDGKLIYDNLHTLTPSASAIS